MLINLTVNGLLWREMLDSGKMLLLVMLEQQVKGIASDNLSLRFVTKTAIGFIREGDGSIGVPPYDRVKLIIHHRLVAFRAGLQIMFYFFASQFLGEQVSQKKGTARIPDQKRDYAQLKGLPRHRCR